MQNYFIGKLSDINYSMAIHEGTANRRLASKALKIRLLSPTEVPDLYKKEFGKLIKLIDNTIKGLSSPGLTPTRLGNMRNSTASKYIKLLIDILEESKEQQLFVIKNKRRHRVK